MSEKDPVQALQQRINAVRTTLWETAQRDELEELVRLVHGPGWSASERALVSASLDQLQALARLIGSLRSELVRVAAQVGRRPEPGPDTAQH
jgi:uncharacterized protein with von Willebrand factor type A (vWA) domain